MENSNQQLASRWKRLGGVIIDSLIMMAVLFPVMMLFGILPCREQGMALGRQILGSIISLCIFLALNGYFLAKQGQTIGKKVVKTRIVDLNGNLCPFARMFVLRYVVIWFISMVPLFGGLFGLVDALVIFGGEKRCIHDYIAGTKVVDA